MNLEELRYPIGRFERPEVISAEMVSQWISDIEDFPAKVAQVVEGLTDEQLDTRYRPEGWTIRQVVHHCADSHMNSLMRFKLALTEDQPTIKPYHEDRWAGLADSTKMPIDPALKMIEGIHERWVFILKNMSPDDMGRTFMHPATGRTIRLDENVGLYAWHGNHHLAHITETLKRKTTKSCECE